jgi:hypothetical protein
MAELILNNLPIVLFLVITVAVRVLQARAKAAARRTEAPPIFASSLEPDEDEAEDSAEPEPLIYSVHSREVSAPAEKTAAARVVLPTTEADRPRFEALPGLSADEGPALYPSAGSEPAVREADKIISALAGMEKNTLPAVAREDGGAFPRLRQYTLPQRAMVWAEILGKPKGME